MTLDEFKLQVRAILMDKLHDPKFIDSLDEDMNETYKESEKLADLLGYGTPDPNGYALGILYLYPNHPEA